MPSRQGERSTGESGVVGGAGARLRAREGRLAFIRRKSAFARAEQTLCSIPRHAPEGQQPQGERMSSLRDDEECSRPVKITGAQNRLFAQS